MKTHTVILNVFLLSICISFVGAQDTLKTEMAGVFSDSLLVTDQKEAMPEGIKETQSSQSESINEFAPESYKWIIKTTSGRKYTSCRFDKITGDTLILMQKFHYNYTPAEYIPLHLDSIKTVQYDILPRILTGVVGGGLCYLPGAVLGGLFSIKLTDKYDNPVFLYGGALGAAALGGWALGEMFSKEYDLSILGTAGKRNKLQVIISKQ